MDSLVDNFTEMDVDIAVLTETWLRDSQEEELRRDLSLGSGLGLLTMNRRPNDNGVSYGGVAVVWRESAVNFVTVPVKNPDSFGQANRGQEGAVR